MLWLIKVDSFYLIEVLKDVLEMRDNFYYGVNVRKEIVMELVDVF